jgi:hypothetical protein
MRTSLLCIMFLLLAVAAFAGGNSTGTQMYDGNGHRTPSFGVDTSKTVSATVTGTKPAFSDTTLVTGTHQLRINCVNPTTGAASAARVKVNNAGTEIPVNGVTTEFVVPVGMTSLAFGKYSTGTATDAVKCTAYGH